MGTYTQLSSCVPAALFTVVCHPATSGSDGGALLVAQPRRELSHTLCRRSSRTPSPVCSRDTFSTVSAALLSSCHTQAFLLSSATSFTRGATRSTTTSTPRKVTLLWVRSTKDLLPSTLDSVVQHP